MVGSQRRSQHSSQASSAEMHDNGKAPARLNGTQVPERSRDIAALLSARISASQNGTTQTQSESSSLQAGQRPENAPKTPSFDDKDEYIFRTDHLKPKQNNAATTTPGSSTTNSTSTQSGSPSSQAMPPPRFSASQMRMIQSRNESSSSPVPQTRDTQLNNAQTSGQSGSSSSHSTPLAHVPASETQEMQPRSESGHVFVLASVGKRCDYPHAPKTGPS